MELWVRSQSKEKLIKVDNIEIFHHYSYKDTQEKYLLPSGSFEYRKVQKKDKYIKSVIACNDEIILGTYKSKERALEVLDEIQNIIRGKYAISLDMKAALSKGISQKEAEKMLMQMAVYEMPEE